jgi:hypothetical protein
MALAKVVVLLLSVYNADTGDLLYESERQMPEFSVSGNRIEDCRIEGVRRAKVLAANFRQTYPNATANVDCEWRLSPGNPA